MSYMNKTDEELNLAEKMAKRYGVRMCDENGDTHGEDLYCVGIDNIADIIREALADHIPDATKMVADPVKRPQNCGTGYCSCIECPYEPVKQEPVAWMWVCVDVESRSIETGLLFNRGADDENTDWFPLYAAPVDAKAIQIDVDTDRIIKSDPLYLQGRAEALEEAAKVCEEQSRESGVAKYPFWNDCATAIRGLK